MPDPQTPAKGLTQPQVGGDNNTWGNLLNADLALIDTALGGTLALSISGNTTLTSTQAENTGYEFIGSISAPATITWPSFYGFAVIHNGTSGGFSIICGLSGGTSVTVLNSETVAIWSDGTNFVQLTQAARTTLTSTLNLYVNSSTGSDSNPGTQASPFQTITHALSIIRQYDLNGQSANIWCVERAAQYDAVTVTGPFVGDQGGNVTINGSPNRTITGATNASPIVITSAAHGFLNGDHVVVHGVRGNTAANGAFIVANVTTNTFSLQKEIDSSNTTGNGTYISSTGIVASPLLVQVPGITAQDGAIFNIAGISLSSLTTNSLQAIRNSTIIALGPVDLAGCPDDGVYSTRGSYIEFDYNFSIGGDFGGQFAQVSHGGQFRKICEGYFRASINVAPFSSFMFGDNGEYVETGSIEVAQSITGASDTTPITITCSNHGYYNDDSVTISGVLGNTAANGTFFVSGATTNTFNILTTGGGNTVGSGTYTSGGTVIRVERGVQGATNASPIVLTVPAHAYNTGDICIVSNVGGNTAANGAWVVTVIDANTFSLYTSGGVASVGNGSFTTAGLVIGPGMTWNQQGFTIPRSGTMQQYNGIEASVFQTSGLAPPPVNYLPGNFEGQITSGSGETGPGYLFQPGANCIIYGDQVGGFFVKNYNGTVNFLGFSASTGDMTVYNASTFLAPITLDGSSSGSLQIQVPATGGNNTLTLPSGTTNFSTTGGTSQVVKQTSSGGAFTVGQVASGDILCSATNDNAAAGEIGQYITAIVASGSAVSLSNATAANITSISLTAGDWDVDAIINISGASSTTISEQISVISEVSSTSVTPIDQMAESVLGYPNFTPFTYVPWQGSSVGPTRVSLAVTTTIYLNIYLVFAVSTASAFGQIRARRVR